MPGRVWSVIPCAAPPRRSCAVCSAVIPSTQAATTRSSELRDRALPRKGSVIMERNLILAIALSICVYVGWFAVVDRFYPKAPADNLHKEQTFP